MNSSKERVKDQQIVYFQRFDERIREYLKTILSDELIEEHKLNPFGIHSDALGRILNYFRRVPQYGLYAVKPCKQFQMISFPVTTEGSPPIESGEIYDSEPEAMHAIFLKHIQVFQLS